MIKNALSTTSTEFFTCTKDMIERILLHSSYPQLFIQRAIAGSFNAVPTNFAGRSKNKNYRYISCPYYVPAFNNVKTTLKSNSIPVMLAPSSFSKNRNLVFSNLKDSIPTGMKKNSMFSVRCGHCEFVYESCSSAVDVTQTVENAMKNPNTKLARHFSEFPTHMLHGSPRIMKTFRNLLPKARTKYFE